MNTTLTQALKFAASGVAIVALTAACTGDSGSSGNLRFQDKSGVTTNAVLPAAAERTVRYNITNTAIQPKDQNVADAESSDDDVFRVTEINGSRITVEALAPGKAELQVVTENDKEDSMKIEVREASDTYFNVEKLNDADAEAGILDVKGSYAIAPGDALELGQHRIFDADGNRLSGDPAPEFESGESGDMDVSQEAILGGSDGDEVTVNNVYGSTLSVRTIENFVAEQLEGYAHEFSLGADLDLPVMTMQRGKTIEFKEAGYIFYVQALDEDGYEYIGSDDLNFSLKASDPNAISMTYLGEGSDKDYCLDMNEEDNCVEWGALPSVIFLITASADAEGDVTLDVSSGNASETFTLKL